MTKKNELFGPSPTFLNRLAVLLAPMDMALLDAGRQTMATPARPARRRHSHAARSMQTATCH